MSALPVRTANDWRGGATRRAVFRHWQKLTTTTVRVGERGGAAFRDGRARTGTGKARGLAGGGAVTVETASECPGRPSGGVGGPPSGGTAGAIRVPSLGNAGQPERADCRQMR